MACYLFFSHDGYGLGHVRRNTVIAQALRRIEPGASIRLVTGVPSHPRWLQRPGSAVVRVPPLLKDASGSYRGGETTFEEAVDHRAAIFTETVERFRPDVAVVDRHPFATVGELREGMELGIRQGVRMVLGLLDVLDDPAVIREETNGDDWAAVPDLFSKVLVYGARELCNHREESGLTVQPTYLRLDGRAAAARSARTSAAGRGGGRGWRRRGSVPLGDQVLCRRPRWRGAIAAGPFADPDALRSATRSLNGRIAVQRRMSECRAMFARAGAVLQTAGYNSTFEALAAGPRSALVPRRGPRREQAIRAERLARRGLADVVEPAADPDDVVRLLDTPRDLPSDALLRAGLDLHGADHATASLCRVPKG